MLAGARRGRLDHPTRARARKAAFVKLGS